MCHGQGHINLLNNSEKVQGHPNILFFFELQFMKILTLDIKFGWFMLVLFNDTDQNDIPLNKKISYGLADLNNKCIVEQCR